MAYEKLQILIPAYKPDEKLNKLIDDLKAAGFMNIIVVDDGGGEPFRHFFVKAKEQGATVLVHEVNRGKGAALKTGLKHIAKVAPGCHVVTADADGQHRPEDIAKLADAIPSNPDALILGSRDKKLMPPRSKTGNTLTCFVFWLTNGKWINDTQTGLRVLPPKTLARFAEIEGDRYEYEMNMLVVAVREKVAIKEIEIETIYIDDNASSHFNALKDGMRIYKLLFKQFAAYAGSSIASFAVDYLVAIIMRFFFPLSVAVPSYTARAVSSLVNFFLNKNVVFKNEKGNKYAIVKYYLLVVVVAVLSVQLTKLLTNVVGLPYLVGKAIADVVLFLCNYKVQDKFVFRKITK
ncbi:MAG: bifunctional glycosyltransferase family 2/GtrA family protein [Clostridia bacterium]|nr:bifunctional glycosyltransferase family 2/GtrA family protein [Clostridia bacterium]MBQ4086537.1 bifunctional glycosyltransferase family 2/GtrA family protein [Clostridia bacterium]